ncbi:MAG: hypothetical protein L6Q98_10495 [Anaerolineae bacterium]|nr:hypothetical protein [Anaerolineae bacterium]NUQ06813.1 hypothetical protein [Anaerolineae bacterium]
MSDAPVMLAMMEPPEPEIIVKRLLKVAEILSRKPSEGQHQRFDGENDLQNHNDQEIGYRGAKDWFIDT